MSPRNVPFKIAREPKRRTKARGDISRFFPSIRVISDQGGGEGKGRVYVYRVLSLVATFVESRLFPSPFIVLIYL